MVCDSCVIITISEGGWHFRASNYAVYVQALVGCLPLNEHLRPIRRRKRLRICKRSVRPVSELEIKVISHVHHVITGT